MSDLSALLQRTKEQEAATSGAALGDARASLAGPPGGGLRELSGLSAALQNKAPTYGVPGQGPKASSVQEELAEGAAERQLGEVAQRADQQARDVATAADRLQGQSAAARREDSLANLALAESYSQREQALLEQARQAKAKGDVAELGAALDQISFYRRLGVERYTTALAQEGALQRLGDKANFAESLAADVFGEDLQTLQSLLGTREVMAGDERAFQEKIAGMDLSAAVKLAGLQQEQANSASMATGASGIIAGGTSAYGAYKKGEFSDDYQKYRDDEVAAGRTPKSFGGFSSDKEKAEAAKAAAAAKAPPNQK